MEALLDRAAAPIDIDFKQAAEIGPELVAQLNLVREAAPIVWSESARGWLVMRHADVVDGFAGKFPLSNQKYVTKMFPGMSPEEQRRRYPLLVRLIPGMITNSDHPQHARLRKLLLRAFSRKVVEDIRPFAQRTIADTLAAIVGKPEIEFVAEVARAITGRVILRLLGIPEENVGRLRDWSYIINSALGAPRPTPETLEAAERVLAEMEALFLTEIERRKQAPGEDFLSQLVTARDENDSLTLDEILGTCVVTLLAGHDTTTNTMALGTVALTQDHPARDYLLGHPDQITDSIIELMRYIAMSTTQTRIAAADFTWHGTEIRKGDIVYLFIASANRDPRYFDGDPDRLDLSRRADMVMTFGPGIHHCIGHLLAKMQLGEFFPAFFRAFPDARVLDERLNFTPALGFRGLETLGIGLGTA